MIQEDEERHVTHLTWCSQKLGGWENGWALSAIYKCTGGHKALKQTLDPGFSASTRKSNSVMVPC